MSSPSGHYEYRKKDVITALFGIPIVMTAAIFVANFATSYAGI